MEAIGEVSIASSLVAPNWVTQRVSTEWEISVGHCRFWKLGQNDTYLADSDQGPLVIRIYRAGVRDAPAIHYELDLIDHLSARGVPAVPSIRASGGRRWVELSAPEGVRPVVVFKAAEGSPADLGNFPAVQYGRLIGALHREADSFRSTHYRPALDLVALVDIPSRAALPWLAPGDQALVETAVELIHGHLDEEVTGALDWGPCHNDVIGNTLRAPDGGLSLFDFDSCAPGWRAHELATVLLQFSSWGTDPQRLWVDFVSGYRQERAIADHELATVPTFVAARYVWLLGLHAAVGDAKGHNRDAEYLSAMIRGLRRWLPGQPPPLDPMSAAEEGRP